MKDQFKIFWKRGENLRHVMDQLQLLKQRVWKHDSAATGKARENPTAQLPGASRGTFPINSGGHSHVIHASFTFLPLSVFCIVWDNPKRPLSAQRSHISPESAATARQIVWKNHLSCTVAKPINSNSFQQSNLIELPTATPLPLHACHSLDEFRETSACP